jgi:gamma-glutamyl:cysteine ligase YbdK (ATP-grasp superfamily)
VGTLNNRLYIAVKPSPALSGTEPNLPEVTTSPTSNWAIIASVPHLWKFLSGAQSAQSDLTKTLLKNLEDSYRLASTSNDAFRAMITAIAEEPTELARSNAQALRDLLQESAETRGEVAKLTRKVEALATLVTRQAQSKN